MVKYRIKFKFEKGKEKQQNRDNVLNEILSDIDNIVSDNPIRKPLEGEVIIISNIQYLVESVYISFEKENDITYYDFVVLLSREDHSIQEEYSEREVWNKILMDKYYEEQLKKYKHIK